MQIQTLGTGSKLLAGVTNAAAHLHTDRSWFHFSGFKRGFIVLAAGRFVDSASRRTARRWGTEAFREANDQICYIIVPCRVAVHSTSVYLSYLRMLLASRHSS